MSRRRTRMRWFWVIQCLTISRVVLVFAFVVMSPFPGWWRSTLAIYVIALLTDFFDGQLARRKGLVTKFGGALDVFGDRYFCVISCVYVGFRGVSLIPLAVILIREIYSVALRMVQIDGEAVMFQNHVLGGFVHTMLAVGTAGYIASPTSEPRKWYLAPFYAVACMYLIYFPYSIWKSRQRIRAAISADLDKPSL